MKRFIGFALAALTLAIVAENSHAWRDVYGGDHPLVAAPSNSSIIEAKCGPIAVSSKGRPNIRQVYPNAAEANNAGGIIYCARLQSGGIAELSIGRFESTAGTSVNCNKPDCYWIFNGRGMEHR